MHQHLLGSGKVTRVMNGVVAGTTEQLSSAVDMQDFDSCVFIAAFGAITSGAVTSLKVQASVDSAFTTPVDLIGCVSAAIADTDDNKLAMIEVYNLPDYRYLRLAVERATQNAVIDGVIAIQHSSRKQPTTHDGTTVSDALVSVSPRPTSTSFTQTTVTPAGTTTRFSQTARTGS